MSIRFADERRQDIVTAQTIPGLSTWFIIFGNSIIYWHNIFIKYIHVLKANRHYSIQVAFCASIGYFGNPSIYIISWQFNWGIAYDLPNQTWIINEQNRMRQRKLLPKQLYQRRHRRELYRKLETAVDRCVLSI